MTDINSYKEMAEQATGVVEHCPDGQLYLTGGERVSDEQAAGDIGTLMIHSPNSGAGSFRSVFERLGFTQVVVLQDGSTAGDWVFLVTKDGQEWQRAYQENRYPYHGFSYSVDIGTYYGTAEEAREQACEVFEEEEECTCQ